jgi:hypothetical protein
MMKSAIVGAAAILASALASSAMAQAVITNPGKCSQYYPDANCQNLGAGNPYTGSYQRRAAYRNRDAYNSYNRWNDDRRSYRDSGFAPGDVAAGVVGGAVGTAAAVATAPLAAFDNSYPGYYYNQSYAQRNGFVCTPGTWFRGEDGRRHLCQ